MAKKGRIRLFVQCCYAAITNGYFYGFKEGTIYKGATKNICLPGLNCYSCPGALGSCPIGSLQAVLGSPSFKVACYVFGFLLLFGSIFGRFVCGWLCPFGLIQDLVYKIPIFKKYKRKNLPGHKYLKYLKYVFLIVFVLLLPSIITDITGTGKPWYCEYICPSGTISGGLPLIIANKGLRSAIGFRFAWKVLLLLVILISNLIIYRPFCKYLCPLGATYSCFNKFSLYRYVIDEEKCTKCGQCQKACKMDIKVWEKPNDFECIRCGDCKRACPNGAISCMSIRKQIVNHKEKENELDNKR